MNQPTDKLEEAREQHAPDCKWERTTSAECAFRDTHHYCPHPEHACTCPSEVPDVAPKRLYVQLTPLGGTISHACDPRSGKPVYEYVPVSALSSRDAQIREVLEGLVVSVIDGENCWCPDPFSADSKKHDAACLAARGLWSRLQS